MYTPTVWEDGDIITKQKLNKIETGIENAGPKIINFTVTEDQGVYSATTSDDFSEALEWAVAKKPMVAKADVSGAGIVEFQLGVVSDTQGNEEIIFWGMVPLGGYLMYITFTWLPDSCIVHLTPIPTESNPGDSTPSEG